MKHWKLSGVLAIGLLGLPLGLRADTPPMTPATLPATQPATPERIDALIRQLGDDEFAVREKATQELVAIGQPAVEAVTQAQKSPDPETASRAKVILQDIDEKAHPKPPQRPPMHGHGQGGIIINNMQGQIVLHAAGGNAESVSVTNNNGVIDTTVTKNGQTFTLHQDDKGMKMTVPDKDNKEKVYEAKDPDDLKKKDPEAYKIYEEKFGNINNGNGNVMHGQIQLRIQDNDDDEDDAPPASQPAAPNRK